MVQLIITGAAGRMGCRLVTLATQDNRFTVIGATEREGHPSLGMDVGEVVGCGTLGVNLQKALASVIVSQAVVIDFSTPQASLENLKLAVSHQTPMVIGTTGFSVNDIQQVQEFAKTIPCVVAPNMSVGVNVTLKIIAEMAKALGDEYDIEIVEAHHRLKKDAPSGTALKMAQVLADATKRDLDQVGVFSRHGMIGERKPKEIGIQTIRAGDIVGDHTVFFGGMGERMEVTHRAQSRDTFAAGALRAAEWVATQPPGVYSMQDVLGIT